MTPAEFLNIIKPEEKVKLIRLKGTDLFLPYWKKLVYKYGPKELKKL